MIVLTILGLANVILGMLIRIAQGQMSLDFSEPENIGRLIGALLIPLVHFIFLYGSILMLKGRGHSSARTAMILACIPICSPLLVIGIPIAIWSLVVLNQTDVKAAFKD